MRFLEKVKHAKEKTDNISFEAPSTDLRLLLNRYNLEIAKISGGDQFSSISRRNIKEMSWLIEAAKCMAFTVKPQHRRDNTTPEEWDNRLKSYNKAIVLLCWIDIMLDDLAENARTSKEASAALMLFDEVEEYIEAKIAGNKPKKISCAPEIETYTATIAIYIDAFFEELNKLPALHEPAKKMMRDGFKSLIQSLDFSTFYRVQMEESPIETMKLYTSNEGSESEDIKETYLRIGSGNMAMQIMAGMFSTLLTPEAAQHLTPISHMFSRIGRIGNDCATGVKEMTQNQMNGIIYWAINETEITAEDIISFTAEGKSPQDLFQKLIHAGVFEQMLKRREENLSELQAAVKAENIIEEEEVRTKMNKLLELELARIPFPTQQ